MRCNKRNKRTIYYSLYQGQTELVDSDGNLTGEHAESYAAPVKARMNVSGGKGRAEVELFGIDTPFTKVAVTEDLKTPFDTDTIWWFGANPDTEAHNFRCTGVARTVNQVAIALAEVDKSKGATAPVVVVSA